MTSNDVMTLDGPVDELDTKKLKQSPEDKRRRNYIAVRKHRQQLKDTLEKCPVRLVELQKEFREMSMKEENMTKTINVLEDWAREIKAKRISRNELNGEEPTTSPDTKVEIKRRPPSTSEEEVEIVEEPPTIKRPKRVYPGGVPNQRFSTQYQSSPMFSSPLLQPQLFTPALLPTFFPNLMSSSPLLQPQFPLVTPLFLQSTPATPMQSPIQMQPLLSLAPDLLQGMVSHDLMQNVTGAVRTAPINFTQDNVDYLWKFCNEQLG